MRFDFAMRHQGVPLMDRARLDTTTLWSTGRAVPPHVEDLLDIVYAAYCADRLQRRAAAPERDGHRLGREIDLVVPVRDLDRLSQGGAPEALSAALDDFSGDTWSVTLVQGKRLGRPVQALFREPLDRPFVGLFSGGLDSLAGAALQAQAGGYTDAVLVNAASSSRLGDVGARLQQRLQSSLPSVRFHRASFDHGLTQQALPPYHLPERQQEKSQRSRGLLFLALGAAVAHVNGQDRLYVYENGVGAINLPYSDAGVGIDHTRAMHPRALLTAERLFFAVFGRPFRIVNPSQWQTKGEMTARLQALGLGGLALPTVSCDGFPLRAASPQCGVCTSCLLRRVSLAAGGLAPLDRAPGQYRHDVRRFAPDRRDRHVAGLRSMVRQVTRFEAALQTQLAAPALYTEFPDLLEARYALAAGAGLGLAEIDARLVRLYAAYVQEWNAFLDTLLVWPHAA